jgi:hypothetical protein
MFHETARYCGALALVDSGCTKNAKNGYNLSGATGSPNKSAC